MDNNLTCFICKQDINNDELKEVKRVQLPNKKLGYVHIKHHGVDKLEEVE